MRRSGVVAYYKSKCSGRSPYGKYLGVKTAQSGQLLIQSDQVVASTQGYAEYTCIDPPHYKDKPRDCAATVGATATGPYYNPDMKATTYYNSGRKNSAFASSNYKNLSLCDKAYTQAFAAGKDPLGQYRMNATGTQVTCTIRQYTTKNAKTGQFPPDEVMACGNERAYDKVEAKWQVWCGGWDPFWDSKHRPFTQQECKDTPKWTCGPNVHKVPKYNGVSVPAAGIGVLDDGTKRAATWAVPNPTGTGVKAVGSKQVILQVGENSTPYRETEGVNGPKQKFTADRKLDTLLPGWANSTWKIGFQAPGFPAPESMWVATPTWQFEAMFKTITFTKVTVDWTTGKVTGGTVVPKWVKDTDTCPGLPLSLSVHRARSIR